MNRYKILKSVLLFFILTLFVVIFLWSLKFFFNDSGNFLSQSAEASLYESIQQDMPNQTDLKSVVQQALDSNINAESYISVKIQSGQERILLSKNEEERLPIASLVKLMSALVVLEKYDLLQKVTVSNLAVSQEGEQGNLKAGEVFSVKDLFYMALIESSNKATFALSEVIGTDKFIDLMNYDAQKLGLANTHFEDSTGLNPKSYSTAEDIAELSGYLFENYPLFREIISIKEFDLYLDDGIFHHKLVNTNKFLKEVPNIVGGKTGWTDFSRGCFMVIEKNIQSDNYTINVILKAEDRFLEMQKLINFINLP